MKVLQDLVAAIVQTLISLVSRISGDHVHWSLAINVFIAIFECNWNECRSLWTLSGRTGRNQPSGYAARIMKEETKILRGHSLYRVANYSEDLILFRWSSMWLWVVLQSWNDATEVPDQTSFCVAVDCLPTEKPETQGAFGGQLHC